MGGQYGTLMFFWKSVTYWPTLSKFRGGPVKKNTLYHQKLLQWKKGNVCKFFSPAALKDGDRQRCIISGRTWHHYSCRDMCALRRLNCAHCANFEHVSPGYQKLCAPVHIPRGCAQYIVQVYITWTLRSICRWSWLNIYLLMAIWCCY